MSVMDVEDLIVSNAKSLTETNFCTPRKYTTYEIIIETCNPVFSLNKSCACRRFSEFLWLRKRLKQHHPSIKPPPLPPKTMLRVFHPAFIALRTKELQTFLRECMLETLYISDSTFHLFVQSPMLCDEIDSYLRGDITQQQVNVLLTKLAHECEYSGESFVTDTSSLMGYDTDICSANSIEATNQP